MYGKIFHSIYDGTLADDWRALITFQQLIVLSDADGIVDMTIQSISRRTGIPLEYLEHGIKVLTDIDPNSRTPDEEGRRLLPINPEREWGWQIVNHKHYRDLRTSDDRREYMRNYMREKRSKQKLTKDNESKQLTQLANKDTNTNTNTSNNKGAKKFKKPTLQEVEQYCSERQNNINAQQFIDHYESNGWMRGKTKIKDWKACVRTWENNRSSNNGNQQQTSKAKRHFDKLTEIANKSNGTTD